jgi:hypothetical protein
MGKGRVSTGFWWEGHRVGVHLKDLGIDRRMILKWTYKKWDGGHGLIGLAQDRVRWWALVKSDGEPSGSVILKWIMK